MTVTQAVTPLLESAGQLTHGHVARVCEAVRSSIAIACGSVDWRFRHEAWL